MMPMTDMTAKKHVTVTVAPVLHDPSKVEVMTRMAIRASEMISIAMDLTCSYWSKKT